MLEEEWARLARRRPVLQARARVLSALRAWFTTEGFLEVETPARVRAPGQEVHLDAISAGTARRSSSDPRWLATSPEYAMKRLCGAGFSQIVSIAKCWRSEEHGPHHQSEFTMIEWYRAHAPLQQLARDCEEILRVAWQSARATIAPFGKFERTTVRDLYQKHVGFDLRGDESVDEMRALAASCGVDAGTADAWDDVFFQIWLDRIEPAIAAAPVPVLVFDWPMPLAALARPSLSDSRIAERFELYAGGLELANAFGELIDPVAQRARFLSESERRRTQGKVTYPMDENLLSALARMPETSGIALGFDRLMMFVLGLADIREVVAFADDEI